MEIQNDIPAPEKDTKNAENELSKSIANVGISDAESKSVDAGSSWRAGQCSGGGLAGDSAACDRSAGREAEDEVPRDDVDARLIPKPQSRIVQENRPVASVRTKADSNYYSMGHGRRGDCIIFVHSQFKNPKMPQRNSAFTDSELCKKAFTKLGFKVEIHWDLRQLTFRQKLKEAGQRDHSGCDALVVVFMSHGGSKFGSEFLETYDESVPTSELWAPFMGNKCTTLAGKPKLFFIQACRGEMRDYGVGMSVTTDSLSVKKKQQEQSYVIPAHADMLIMWASSNGMYAFKSEREGFNGSVFIHFLAQTLEKEGGTLTLYELLLKVSRKVALNYESYCPGKDIDANKQVPQILSTLLRGLVLGDQ